MTDKPEQDLYDLLGVPSTATGADLDHAFRLLARRLHPDADQDSDCDSRDGDAFQRVLTAYAVLRDPVARGNYDRRRSVTGRTNRVRPRTDDPSLSAVG